MIGRWWKRGEDETPVPEPQTPPVDFPEPETERLTPDTPRHGTPQFDAPQFDAPHAETPHAETPQLESEPEAAPLEAPPEFVLDAPTVQPDEVEPDEVAASAPDVGDQIAVLADKVDELATQLSRMAREQLRANEIGERALREARESAALARTAVERRTVAAQEPRFPGSRTTPPGGSPAEVVGDTDQKSVRVMESLMPVLDAIEAGLESGRAQIDHLDDTEARALLAAWLDGQRLLRDRVLALFEREGIRPMDALGQRFDPFRHVAVERTFDPLRVPGTIVSERRHGYELGGRVLRFAEVIVTTDRADNGQ